MVRHNNKDCVDSVLAIEEGRVSKIYPDNNFEIRYIDPSN